MAITALVGACLNYEGAMVAIRQLESFDFEENGNGGKKENYDYRLEIPTSMNGSLM